MNSLSVSEHWRRQGVAYSLVEEAERLSSLWGYGEMLLHVCPENAVAYDFYRRRGYQKIGMKWWSGEELMRKPLQKIKAPFLAPSPPDTEENISQDDIEAAPKEMSGDDGL